MSKLNFDSEKKSLLILAIGFLPNIGGLETHLKDLIDELIKKQWKIIVLTYQPLHTPIRGKWIEKFENLSIYRLPSIRGLFYKLLQFPPAEFLFLGPLLFIVTPVILLKYKDIRVINAQGIIAGFVAAFWSRILRKKYVVSAQSVYHFPAGGIYREICKWIFNSADQVIAISSQTKHDIESLGIESNKITVYTNWEDSNFFKPEDKKIAKEKIDLADKFVVSFFGRLVEEKGVKVLIEAIKNSDTRITFAIYGEGPLANEVREVAKVYSNVFYMGTVTPDKLPLHYSAADLVVMPTLNEEGFGRVAAGSLFCGTPVIASNKGALPEVVNETVGKVIIPTPQNIAQALNFYYSHRELLKRQREAARKYALKKFSSKNAESIISIFDALLNSQK